ncbi:Protein of unknown function, partial [Gryllus bimaculatus]
MPGRGCSDARATQLAAAFGLVSTRGRQPLSCWCNIARWKCEYGTGGRGSDCERGLLPVRAAVTRGMWSAMRRLLESCEWSLGPCDAFCKPATRAVAPTFKLLRAARREGRPPPTCFMVYFAWLLAALLDVVLDAVFIPHYALDISHAKGARNVMRLLQVSALTAGWPQALPPWAARAPALPPVVLLVVGSRVAPLLWVAEGAAVGRVAAAARRLHQRRRQMLRRSGRGSQ